MFIWEISNFVIIFVLSHTPSLFVNIVFRKILKSFGRALFKLVKTKQKHGRFEQVQVQEDL